MLGGYTLLFHQSIIRIIYAFGKLFVGYIFWRGSCKLFVLYISNSFQNSLYWYPSTCIKNNNKIGLLGNFGRMYLGCSPMKSVFAVHCVIKRILDRAPWRYPNKRTRLRLWLPKARKVLSRFSSFLQVSRSSRKNALQQEWINCTVSSLPLLFGLIDVILHLTPPFGSPFMDSFTTFGLIASGRVILSTTTACY